MALHTYTPTEWKNAPDHKTTPINATNLNNIETGIENAYTDIAEVNSFDPSGTDLVSITKEDAIKEVNERTKHGIVELWTNANPTNAFAGQTINITQADLDSRGLDVNINDIDAVDMEFEIGDISVVSLQARMGARNQPWFFGLNNTGKLTQYYRQCNISRANNTISIVVADCTSQVLNSYGSAPTISTANNFMVPTIITGLIHNS